MLQWHACSVAVIILSRGLRVQSVGKGRREKMANFVVYRACDYEVTIAVLGDGGVGKYSLISKFSHPEVSTAARDLDHDIFERKLTRVHGKTVEVHIFSPHSGYRTDYSMWTALQPQVTGALLVFDLTDDESLYRLKHHFTELYNHVGEDVKTVLVGNKKDLLGERMVEPQVAKMFANSLGCLSYVETSAVMEETAKVPFVTLISALLDLDGLPEEEETKAKSGRFSVSGSSSTKGAVASPKSQHKHESHLKTIKELKQTVKSLQQQLVVRDNDIKHMERRCDQRLYAEQQDSEETLKRYQQASESSLRKMKQLHEEALSNHTQQNARTVFAIQDDCVERVEQAMESVQSLEQRLAEAERQAAVKEENNRSLEQRLAEAERQAAVKEESIQSIEQRLAEAERQAAVKEDSKLLWLLKKEELEMTDKVLGTGGWGVVKVAKFRGLQVAAKCIHSVIITAYNRALFFREMDIAARVRHPHLVQFIGATTEGAPILLTELMDSTLREMLENDETQFSKEQVVSICQDIGLALNYLHLMKPDPIIHRDVSSANILLECSSGSVIKAKLSDYGSANFIKHVKTAAPGSPAYAAPESLTPKLQSPKMDVFSYGVLMAEAFLCQFPDPAKREEMIQSLEKKHPSIARLAKQCLLQEPKERPTMSYILENL